MYQIQVPKTKAQIQLSKLPSQTMAKKQVKVVQEKPVEQKFNSIFSLQLKNSDTLQLMDSGASAIPETAEEIPQPLVKDQLNLVGEDHDESEPRRDQEREYVLKYHGWPQYWNEDQFPARPLTFWENLQYNLAYYLPSIFSFSDNRPFADPFREHFFILVFLLEESYTELVLEFADQENTSKPIGEYISQLNNSRQLKKCYDWIIELEHILGTSYLYRYNVVLTEEEKKSFEKLRQPCKDVADSLEGLLKKPQDDQLQKQGENIKLPFEAFVKKFMNSAPNFLHAAKELMSEDEKNQTFDEIVRFVSSRNS